MKTEAANLGVKPTENEQPKAAAPPPPANGWTRQPASIVLAMMESPGSMVRMGARSGEK